MENSLQQTQPPSIAFVVGVIIVVFALTSGLFATLSYREQSNRESKRQSLELTLATPRPINSWNDYINDQYGFSVLLPDTFSMEPRSGVNGKDQVGFEFIDITKNGFSNEVIGSVTVLVSPTTFKTTQEFYMAKKNQVAQDPGSSDTVVKTVGLPNNISAVGIYNSSSNCPFGLWAVNKGYLYELEGIYSCGSSIANNPTLVTIANSFKFTK